MPAAEVMNDVLNLLHRSNKASADLLIPILIATAKDIHADEIFRDYAIQHLVHTYRTCSPDLALSSESHLASWLKSPENKLTGTALFSLSEIVAPAATGIISQPVTQNTTPQMDLGTLLTESLDLVTHPASCPELQSTALNVLFRNKDSRAAQAARKILNSENASELVVRTAIGVLAETGTTSDIPLIESIHSPTLSRTVNYAIKRLNARS